MGYSELESLLILNALGGGVKLAESLKNGMAASEIMEAILKHNFLDKKGRLESLAGSFDPENELKQCEKNSWKLITLKSPEYPFLLRHIADPPLVLYLAGNLEESDNQALAMVGSRHPSLYGLEQTRKFSESLSDAGLTIISGFAKGVDQEAHRGALSVSYGRTIAVLGCGLDVPYPRGHEKLFEQISLKGAVISEYPLGTSPRAENFPKRNRIISGLSLGVFVVEAHQKSGSLITAHQAAEQGRDIFALPGQVDRLTSKGTHLLIKEGACLVECPEDILQALKTPLRAQQQCLDFDAPLAEEKSLLSSSQPTPVDLSEEETLCLALISQKELSFDDLFEQWNNPNLAQIVLGLELKGKVSKGYDGSYKLIPQR